MNSSNSSSGNVDIMSFNKEKLNLINNDFNRLGMQLSLEQFLKIMLHHSDLKEEGKQIEYVEALIDAFKQIDVNGDASLEWDEFSNYIVENGIAKQKKSFIDVIRNYHLSLVTKDIQKHENEIEKVFFFAQLKHLIVLESYSKKIKVYNYLTASIIKEFVAHNGYVLCAEYISNQNIVVTSGTDNTLMFWDPIGYVLLNKIPTREIQLVLKYTPKKKYLLTGGFDSVINCYKRLEFEESGKLKNSVDLFSMKSSHSSFINDIIIVESHNFIVACDLEGVISLWNLNTLEHKQDLKGHSKGVLSLCWLEDRNLLLSSGYEHEVYIWDIVVGKKINSLQGHSQSLIGIKIFPGTPQIITGDVSGIFKVWDLRSMNLVQTFSIPTSINKRANSFVVTTIYKKRIIIGADKVYFYDYEESKEGNLVDSKSCIAVLYNEIFKTFVTVHIDSIKIWKVETGELVNVFRDLTNHEISTVCFDYRKRKLFIGDVEGNLILINILNGVQMKYFTPHHDYISSMTYYSEGKKFMSASWDGSIKVHDDDTSEEKGQLLSVFGNISSGVKGKMISCNTVDFSEKLELLASGFDNGFVTLINMKTLSNEGSIPHDKLGKKNLCEKKTFLTEEEKRGYLLFSKESPKIKLVKFLNNFQCIITCDNLGRMFIWTLVPSKPRKTVLDYTIENLSINENNKKDFFPVKCLCFEEKTNYLLFADETGRVKAWDLKNYINYLTKMIEIFDDREKDLFLNKEKDSIVGRMNSHNRSSLDLDKFDMKTPLERYEKMRENLDLKPDLVKEFIAHKNSVNSICCNSDPIFFATAGLDCKVHIWNKNFEKIGSLTTIKDGSWSLKIDIEKENIRKREEAIEKYKQCKQITYDSLFENELRISSYDNHQTNSQKNNPSMFSNDDASKIYSQNI